MGLSYEVNLREAIIEARAINQDGGQYFNFSPIEESRSYFCEDMKAEFHKEKGDPLPSIHSICSTTFFLFILVCISTF